MQVTGPSKKLRFAGLLSVAVFVSVCGYAPPSERNGATTEHCLGTNALPSDADFIRTDGLLAQADLNCDGYTESLSISWGETDGFARPRVDLRGHQLSGAAEFPMEVLPQFIAFGDLTGNGFRDILLAIIDESVVLPQVVLVGAEGLSVAHLSDELSWRDLQYIWGPEAIKQDCEQKVRPFMEFSNSHSAEIVVTSGNWSDHQQCLDPQRVRLRVVDGVLVEATQE